MNKIFRDISEQFEIFKNLMILYLNQVTINSSSTYHELSLEQLVSGLASL